MEIPYINAIMLLSSATTSVNRVISLMPHAIWRANEVAVYKAITSLTGFSNLDAELPNGGWPKSTLVELLLQQAGIGELQLLKPALVSIAKTQRIAFVQPPHILNGLTFQAWDLSQEKSADIHRNTIMRTWISLALRYLPLEALRPCWSEPGAYAIIDKERVLTASRDAVVAGVGFDMRRGGVSAIAPGVIMLDRDLERENLAFEAIAMTLLRYTPEVTYAADNCILLDVTASLTLFGGHREICRLITQSIRTLGFTCRLACAPTAMAAWLLSRAPVARNRRNRRRTIKVDTMTRAVDRLPVGLLPGASKLQDWLQGIGCESIGQLRLYPRAALQRRTNQQLLLELDKAYGMAPEL
ncbi:hypothetical protein DAPPUDRAFT_338433, partial [Daphnia pulex]